MNGNLLLFHHECNAAGNRVKYALFIGKLQKFRRISKAYFLPFTRIQMQADRTRKLFQRFIRRAVLMTEEKRYRCFRRESNLSNIKPSEGTLIVLTSAWKQNIIISRGFAKAVRYACSK